MGSIKTIIAPLVFITLLLNALPPGAASLNGSQPTKDIWELKPPVGCPTEFFMGIRQTHRNVQNAAREGSLHAVGDEISFECSDSSLFVYPTPTRTCLQDGTWSGAPPLCISSNSSGASKVIIREMRLCPANDCAQQTLDGDDWIAVGQHQGRCSARKANSTLNRELRQMLLTFSQPVHLSFVTFPVLERDQHDESQLFYIQVKARRRYTLSFLSNEVQALLQKHYDAHSRNQRSDKSAPSECTLTQIGAYTSEIIVDYPHGLINTSVLPTFFSILNGNQNRSHSSDCAQPPTIPEANLTLSENGQTAKIVCQNGYVLLNPLNRNIYNGLLNCSREYAEWHPYPFPVCRRAHKITNIFRPRWHRIDRFRDSTKSFIGQATIKEKNLASVATSTVIAIASSVTNPGVMTSSVEVSSYPINFPGTMETKPGQPTFKDVELQEEYSTTIITHPLRVAMFVLMTLGAVSLVVIVCVLVKHFGKAWLRSKRNDCELIQSDTANPDERRALGYLPNVYLVNYRITAEAEPIYASVHEEDYDDVTAPFPITSPTSY